MIFSSSFNSLLRAWWGFSFYFTFEVDEKLSITELKDEAQLFILNKSYVDAISNYEKIYDIQSLIFGSQNKNLSETLIVLGDLYYKIDDELKAIYHSNDSVCMWVFKTRNDRKNLWIKLLEC